MPLCARGVAAAGRVAVGAALAADPRRRGRPEHAVDRFALGRRRGAVEELQVHDCYFAGTASCDAACPVRSASVSRSTRIALALNSAVPDLGSVASIVSTFVSTWSGK